MSRWKHCKCVEDFETRMTISMFERSVQGSEIGKVCIFLFLSIKRQKFRWNRTIRQILKVCNFTRILISWMTRVSDNNVVKFSSNSLQFQQLWMCKIFYIPFHGKKFFFELLLPVNGALKKQQELAIIAETDTVETSVNCENFQIYAESRTKESHMFLKKY